MKHLLRIAQISAMAPVALAVSALFLMMIMTFADVILRSAFNMPIEAATELTRILMAILVFSALPLVSGQGEHISVDLMDPVLGKAGIRWMDALTNLGCGAMLWWPGASVIALSERARNNGDVTEYLNIPQFYIGWFIAVCTYLTMVVLLARGMVLLFAPAALEKKT